MGDFLRAQDVEYGPGGNLLTAMPDLGMGIRWLPRPRSARLISLLPVLILTLSRGPAIRPCVGIGHSVVNG